MNEINRAASNGNLELVKHCVEAGADVNSIDEVSLIFDLAIIFHSIFISMAGRLS